MPVRVPVLRTEQITTPAPESGQTDSFPATKAPINHLLHHRNFVPLQILQLLIYNNN
ncbi:hypothetical protein HanIR_Chr17g0887591 [Helianthus annuus]|nr:hypothetical protein HanIR_Chr17g0887591 [Helianthus annuus]